MFCKKTAAKAHMMLRVSTAEHVWNGNCPEDFKKGENLPSQPFIFHDGAGLNRLTC